MTLRDFEEAHEKAAQLVAIHGERFVPAFLEAERRLEIAKSSQCAITRAREIARSMQNAA
ncbi:hypothetical protein [Thalassobius sp. Cn5-15]|uniref:hypothetical protein n=1 Tax=Thalassobius sp. Cn5-15 TaxID=2917763 RepID=UPI001EF2FAB0|nr:hypothetical protein [Thalassobius sp. Cn5-15]MCG7492409.1 hypothetical protein [Thalassobius sp. Cn5-15]